MRKPAAAHTHVHQPIKLEPSPFDQVPSAGNYAPGYPYDGSLLGYTGNLEKSHASGHRTPPTPGAPEPNQTASTSFTAASNPRRPINQILDFRMLEKIMQEEQAYARTLTPHAADARLRGGDPHASGAPYPVRPAAVSAVDAYSIYLEPPGFTRKHFFSRTLHLDRWKQSGSKNRGSTMLTRSGSPVITPPPPSHPPSGNDSASAKGIKVVQEVKYEPCEPCALDVTFRRCYGAIYKQTGASGIRYNVYEQIFADTSRQGPKIYQLIRTNSGTKCQVPAPLVVRHASKTPSADMLAKPLLTLLSTQEKKSTFVQFEMKEKIMGKIQANEKGLAMTTTAGDFAEWHAQVDPFEILDEGTVVGFQDGKVGACTANSLIFGVVSERAAVVGNAPLDMLAEKGVTVAYCGRVPVRVLGPVKAGDVLVPSGADDGMARVRPSDSGDACQIACKAAVVPSCSTLGSNLPIGVLQPLGVVMVGNKGNGVILAECTITPPAMTREVIRGLNGRSRGQSSVRAILRALLLAAMLVSAIAVLTLHVPKDNPYLRQGGGGGGASEDSIRPTSPGCTDIPGWASSTGWTCAETERKHYCGEGSLATHATGGRMDAVRACCACGGGIRIRASTAATIISPAMASQQSALAVDTSAYVTAYLQTGTDMDLSAKATESAGGSRGTASAGGSSAGDNQVLGDGAPSGVAVGGTDTCSVAACKFTVYSTKNRSLGVRSQFSGLPIYEQLDILPLKEYMPACPREPSKKWQSFLGWPADTSTLSAPTTPCNVESFIANLAPGAGYFSDPGMDVGFCRTIFASKVQSVRADASANRNWYGALGMSDQKEGTTYLPAVAAGCTPHSAKACEVAAKAAGLTLGGRGYPFNSKDANASQKSAYNAGCYLAIEAKGCQNAAFYGDFGTFADKTDAVHSGQSRMPGADCVLPGGVTSGWIDVCGGMDAFGVTGGCNVQLSSGAGGASQRSIVYNQPRGMTDVRNRFYPSDKLIAGNVASVFMSCPSPTAKPTKNLRSHAGSPTSGTLPTKTPKTLPKTTLPTLGELLTNAPAAPRAQPARETYQVPTAGLKGECPAKSWVRSWCSECSSGGYYDGGAPLVATFTKFFQPGTTRVTATSGQTTVCNQWCSLGGYCGNGGVYKPGGIDCRRCVVAGVALTEQTAKADELSLDAQVRAINKLMESTRAGSKDFKLVRLEHLMEYLKDAKIRMKVGSIARSNVLFNAGHFIETDQDQEIVTPAGFVRVGTGISSTGQPTN